MTTKPTTTDAERVAGFQAAADRLVADLNSPATQARLRVFAAEIAAEAKRMRALEDRRAAAWAAVASLKRSTWSAPLADLPALDRAIVNARRRARRATLALRALGVIA
jgi:DNA-binding transcriptional regulator PaaX